MKKFIYIGTEEQLIESGFEISDSGNYRYIATYRNVDCDITILDYDGKKHIIAFYFDEVLGFISCNPLHTRFGKSLFTKGLVKEVEE